MSMFDSIQRGLEEGAASLAAFRESAEAMEGVRRFAEAILRTLQGGGKLMACGNGGSMSDAMHFVEEWTGRYRHDRPPLPAIAFSDAAQMTCIANDFGYDEVFARPVAALGKEGDLLVAISTSGNSPNLLRAVEEAAKLGVTTVGLLGRGGGQLAGKVDLSIVVPHAKTPERIQEIHIKVLHNVIEAVERELFPEDYA